jgi:hypothetical protein
VNEFEMITAIVGTGSCMILLIVAMETVKKIVIARMHAVGGDSTSWEALNQLQEEVRQLRQATQDGVLSFDSTLQRIEARLQHLEQRALGTGAAPPVRGIVVPAPNTAPVPTVVLVAGAPQAEEQQARVTAR